ncbi:MAG: tetraacyldisaccharide 4'-kinase [Candidatus Aminicenantes bacterium]|nr:MAG: tetraacyldisaccharide 4'-kinase [Candidatus Aminicenantes bacterium]
MKPFLHVFSLLHRSGCRIKNWLYKRKVFKPKRAPLPVISVGNISFGGSGKTPLVLHLLTFLINKGYKPALITRGYRGKWEKRGGILSDGKSVLGTWQDAGDEAFMIASSIPQAGVFIGKNRLFSCQNAKASGFDLAVLDDGFQHSRLRRDIDIVLYDSREKVALRESVSSLGRAGILLLERGLHSQEKESLKKSFPQSAIFEYSVESKGFFKAGEKKEESGEEFQGKRIIAFCGIARPGRFLALLQHEGISPVDFLTFSDHYSYPLHALEKISKKFKKLNADAIITTEKDMVKIAQSDALHRIPLYYLKIDLRLDDEFYSMLSSVVQKMV